MTTRPDQPHGSNVVCPRSVLYLHRRHRILRSSPAELLSQVPLELFGVWVMGSVPRQRYTLPVERVVATTVRKIVLESAAHDKVVVRGDPYVSLVEEAMDVAAHEKPVGDLTRTIHSEWPDVCGL